MTRGTSTIMDLVYIRADLDLNQKERIKSDILLLESRKNKINGIFITIYCRALHIIDLKSEVMVGG